MTQSVNDKTMAVTSFLNGTRKPEIMTALGPYGFGETERAKGSRLLFDVFNSQAQSTETASAQGLRYLVEAVDRWDNHWVAIAEISLSVQYPSVFDKVFSGLTRESSLAAAPMVTRFMLRMEALATGTEEEQDAFALLEKRGLTASVRQEVKQSITQIFGLPSFPSNEDAIVQFSAEVEESQEVKTEGSPEEVVVAAYEERVALMWNWYREWSAIARKVIRRKDYLITLGLRKRKRSNKQDNGSGEEASATESTPASSTPTNAASNL